MVSTESSPVRRRRVFYIPGYDPIHPRRYRELYRREGRKQARISGYEIALEPLKGRRYGWRVFAGIEGFESQADFEVLVWSDIVRKSMSGSILATYLQMLRTAALYIGSGTFRRLMWLRKGPVLAALYPVLMLCFQFLVSLGVGALAAAGVTGLIGWLHDRIAGLFGAGPGPGAWPVVEPFLWWPVFLAAAVYLLQWFKAQDGKLYAYYLMHDYAYACQRRGAYGPELEARIAEFGDVIAGALAEDVDEVLIVGHSSGAYLGVSILADLIRQGRVPAGGPALSFLSLGQVIPMVSFLPGAKRLRADLNYLSTREDVTWVDVTAPGDGCAFALCDPVAVSGVAPEDKRWPLVFSAAFTQTLAPETWQKMRWRFFRLHFQYLCAFDRPRDYDYFQITAGPWSLGDRYADRQPSRNRIDVAASRYTSMAA